MCIRRERGCSGDVKRHPSQVCHRKRKFSMRFGYIKIFFYFFWYITCDNHPHLDGGNSILSLFSPRKWFGEDWFPFWFEHIFQRGWLKPPTNGHLQKPSKTLGQRCSCFLNLFGSDPSLSFRGSCNHDLEFLKEYPQLLRVWNEYALGYAPTKGLKSLTDDFRPFQQMIHEFSHFVCRATPVVFGLPPPPRKIRWQWDFLHPLKICTPWWLRYSFRAWNLHLVFSPSAEQIRGPPSTRKLQYPIFQS